MSCFDCNAESGDCEGYYEIEKQGVCFFSHRNTNFYDIYFQAWLHPDYYHEAWQAYADALQSNVTIEG